MLPTVPGYSETFFRNKIRGLRDNGFEVILFVENKAINNEDLDCDVVVAPNFRVHKMKGFLTVIFTILKCIVFYPKSSLKHLRLDKEDGFSFPNRIKRLVLNQFLFRYKLKWLHFGFGMQAIDRENVASAIGAQMAVSFRGADLYLSPIKHPGCYDLLFTKNIQYHVLSEEMKQDLNNYGVQLDHIHVITPAINTEFFKATVASRKANEPLQLITVARLHWKKGIIYTLEALSHLRRDIIDFKYTIIGDGEEIERIKFAIYQLDLQDHVILAGKCSQEEVRRRLESSDIYLQYSIQEGFCNAALEAQSMGLMTIVSNAEGLTENVQHMRSGWVVPKRQPKQLAQKIVEVMKLPDSEKDDIRHFAMKRVKDEFNLRKQNREFKQFYLSVD